MLILKCLKLLSQVFWLLILEKITKIINVAKL